MRNLYLLLFFFILTAASLSRAGIIVNPYFWEVRFQGEVQGYLLGSFHYGFSEGDLPQYILDKIKTSEIFFAENLGSYGDPNPPSPQIPLDKRLSQAAYLKFLDITKSLGEDPQRFMYWTNSKIKRFLLRSIVYDGNREVLTFDHSLLAVANKAGIETKALDRLGDPRLHKNLEHIESDIMLINTILNYESLKIYIPQQMIRYSAGGGSWLSEPSGSYERHVDWLPRILEESVGKRFFIVAGLTHFNNINGLGTLLQKHGFQVHRRNLQDEVFRLKVCRRLFH